MAGMDLWVASLQAFEELDRYINTRQTRSELQALDTAFHTAHPGFGPGGVLDPAYQGHFNSHWINPADGTGGDYWPYLNKINIRKMLSCAFEVSVHLLVTARDPGISTGGSSPRFDKHHMTIWICALPTPSHGDRANIAQRKDLREQEQLFRIAVVESDYEVLVVISTPEPIGDEVKKPYLGLTNAFPINHWRVTIIDDNCVWSQCVHPMRAPLGDPPEGVSFGEGPTPSSWQPTVPGDWELPPLPTR